MAKTPKAQYEKLVNLSSINLQTKLLLELVDIPKALSHSPESPEEWAEMAREAAANLLSLADKISNNKRAVKKSALFEALNDSKKRRQGRPRSDGLALRVLELKEVQKKTWPEVTKILQAEPGHFYSQEHYRYLYREYKRLLGM